MAYVDGFVIPMPEKNLAAYKKMATWGRKVWMKHGALQYFECVGDDLNQPPGCGDFKKMASLKSGEVLFFSFIIYKNKAHRNKVNKLVMAEMAKHPMPKDMPFDMNRMAFGGFKAIIKA